MKHIHLTEDMETLAAYIGNTLSDDEKQQIEEHLADCDECRKFFVLTNEILKDEEVPEWETADGKKAEEILNKIKEKTDLIKPVEVFCQWIKASLSDLASCVWFSCFESQAALSAVRSVSAEKGTTIDYLYLKKNIHDLETEMYIRKMEDHKADLKIRISKQGVKVGNIRLTLKGEGMRDVSRPLRDEYVLFEKLSFGNYDLILIQRGTEAKQEYHFTFKLDETGIQEQYE